MVDIGKKTRQTDICAQAQADTRKVPMEIWVRETKPIIEKLTRWQTEKKLTYAAFGATALGALGYSRATKDVDIVVKSEEWTFDKVADELAKEFGLTRCPGKGQKVQMLVREIQGYHYVVELWDDYIYVMDCDDQMWEKVQLGQVLGFPFVTLSTEDMVSSKLGRFFVEHQQEDMTDIAFLLKNYGIKNFDYFLKRIERIKRSGKTIDDFLFEEMLGLSNSLGVTETTKLNSEIVRKRPYRQILTRIMFDIAKKSKSIEEVAEKALIDTKIAKDLLEKLEIETVSGGFKIPTSPDAAISNLLK